MESEQPETAHAEPQIQTQQPCIQPQLLSEQPFRFLDLPKDIRFLIYDYLVAENRHHSITFHHDYGKYALAIVSKRIPGIAILATCKQIHHEANSVCSTALKALSAPVKIATHWRAIDTPALRGVLHCASNNGPCSCNNALNEVLLKIDNLDKTDQTPIPCSDTNVVDEYVVAANNVQSEKSSTPDRERADIMFGQSAQSDDVWYSDITSHAQLHALIRRNHIPGARRVVEIAVLCPMEIKLPKLRTGCTHFYKWLQDMHLAWMGDSAMHIKLRPRPESEAARIKMEVDYAFWNADSPPSSFMGRKWSYELGGWLQEDEWEAEWAASDFA
ncbi:hypothetical protein NX059_010166 [Plenodomus lindquistii]|nr:hypothetical protein NX059_010166 [Plenodomus lindquistii]